MSATNEASPAGETGDIERLVMPVCKVHKITSYTWNCKRCGLNNVCYWIGGIPDKVRCGSCITEYKTEKA